MSKGYSEKALKKTRKKTVRKMFFNQITIHIFNKKLINVKVFNNGKIQMTGLNNPDQGKETIDILIQELSKLNNKEKHTSLSMVASRCCQLSVSLYVLRLIVHVGL